MRIISKLNKTKTLNKNYEFKRVFAKGKCYTEKYITAFILKNNKNINIDLDKNYLGIAVSVKVAKAVKRNRIKRLIRENYRMLEDKINKGYSIVILLNKKINIMDITYDKIEKNMRNIFIKSELM